MTHINNYLAIGILGVLGASHRFRVMRRSIGMDGFHDGVASVFKIRVLERRYFLV